MPKNFGKNLAKSFKYGVIDTFLEKTAPDISETLKSNKEDIKNLMDSGVIKGLNKKDLDGMLKQQSTEIKKGFNDVRKNILSDLKSGKWFGNKERASQGTMKFMFGDDPEMMDFFGSDDFFAGLDMETGTKTVKKNQRSGDIDFSFENTNETNINDNRTNVNNITTIQNKVDGRLLASVTGTMVNNMSTISTQIKQISQFHLEETRNYYKNSLSILTDINNTLKNVYNLQSPKSKASILNDIFNGDSISLSAYGKELGKNISESMLGMITDSDNRPLIKAGIESVIADPLKGAISLAMKATMPEAIKKGMEELNNNFTDTMKTLVLQLSEGKRGRGTPLQKFLGSIFGLDLGNSAKVKFENKAVPFDAETKRAIVNTIPELLSRIYSAISQGGNSKGAMPTDKFLRVDYDTGKLTYEPGKKSRSSDDEFARKLVGNKYDYSRIKDLSEKDLAAQKKIDALNKKLKDLQNKKKGFWDTSQDKNIQLARNLLKSYESRLSIEGRDKIKQAQKSRGEDFDEFSEMLYKYATTLGSNRRSGHALSSSAIKTISAKEFERRKAGGVVTTTTLDEDISNLDPEKRQAFANLLKSVEVSNRRTYGPNAKGKKVGEIWEEARSKNLNEKGKLGFKGTFKTISDFTNSFATQFFGKLNSGLSNLMFGNEKGFKSNIANKIGTWANKNEDRKGPLGFIARKTKGFLADREDAQLKLAREQNNEQKKTREAVEKLLTEATSENCISVVVQRFGKKAKEFQESVANNLGVETEGKTGKEIRSGIKSAFVKRVKGKFITDSMRTSGLSEDDKITVLVHHRMKEFMDPIAASFKKNFFGDEEDSIKNQIRFFLTGKKGKDAEKTGKSLLDRLAGDFINFLRNPVDKKGNPVEPFLEQWKNISLTFVDELKYYSKKLLKAVWSGVKAYYRTLFKIGRGIFDAFGRTRFGKKFMGATKSFGRYMGERFMGVTNFASNLTRAKQAEQLRRIGGKVNEDGTLNFEGVDREELKKYRGLANIAKKQGIKVASEDTNIIKNTITTLQEKVLSGIEKASNTIVRGFSRAKELDEIAERQVSRWEKKTGKKASKRKRKELYGEAVRIYDIKEDLRRKGAFDPEKVKAEKDLITAEEAQQKTAEGVSELVTDTKKQGKLGEKRWKKILSYITMGFLLLKGGTATITTVIKGVASGIKIVVGVVKTIAKALTLPLKLLNAIAKSPAGGLLARGLVTVTLLSYLTAKVKEMGMKVVNTVKSGYNTVKSGADFIFGKKNDTGTRDGGAVDSVKKAAEKLQKSREKHEKTLQTMDIVAKKKELATKFSGILDNVKKSKIANALEIAKDKAIGGAKRVVELVGSGIKGIGTAVQAIPLAGQIAAAAIGAAGLIGTIALVSKKLKDANKDSVPSGSDNEAEGILSKFKKHNAVKKAEKEEKEAKTKNTSKAKVSRNVTKLKSMNEEPKYVTASTEKFQVGQEKEGLIWNGSKWISRANLTIGQTIGKMVWNGIRFVSYSKETDNQDRELWWQRMMSIGLLGEPLDRKNTKANSLASKLKNFISGIKSLFTGGGSNNTGVVDAGTTPSTGTPTQTTASASSPTTNGGKFGTFVKRLFGIGNNVSTGSTTNNLEKENTGNVIKYPNNSDLVNKFPYFSQKDNRWSNVMYSSRGDVSQTIGSSACGPTAMAMVLRSFGEDVTPVETSSFAVQNGHRTANNGTDWGFFSNIGKKYGLVTTNIGGNINAAASYLSQGVPMIATGRGSKPFTSGGHFVVFSGMDSNGNIMVNDPVSKDRSTTYSVSDLASKVTNMWAFTKNGKGSINNIVSVAPSTLTSTVTNTSTSSSSSSSSSSTASSTGYSNSSSFVNNAIVDSSATTSSNIGYSEIISKLTTISTILSNIASFDETTANTIKQFLEESGSQTNSTANNAGSSNTTNTQVINDGGNNNFFSPSNTNVNLANARMSHAYNRFLRPSTIEIAKGN